MTEDEKLADINKKISNISIETAIQLSKNFQSEQKPNHEILSDIDKLSDETHKEKAMVNFFAKVLISSNDHKNNKEMIKKVFKPSSMDTFYKSVMESKPKKNNTQLEQLFKERAEGLSKAQQEAAEAAKAADPTKANQVLKVLKAIQPTQIQRLNTLLKNDATGLKITDLSSNTTSDKDNAQRKIQGLINLINKVNGDNHTLTNGDIGTYKDFSNIAWKPGSPVQKEMEEITKNAYTSAAQESNKKPAPSTSPPNEAKPTNTQKYEANSLALESLEKIKSSVPSINNVPIAPPMPNDTNEKYLEELVKFHAIKPKGNSVTLDNVIEALSQKQKSHNSSSAEIEGTTTSLNLQGDGIGPNESETDNVLLPRRSLTDTRPGTDNIPSFIPSANSTSPATPKATPKAAPETPAAIAALIHAAQRTPQTPLEKEVKATISIIQDKFPGAKLNESKIQEFHQNFDALNKNIKTYNNNPNIQEDNQTKLSNNLTEIIDSAPKPPPFEMTRQSSKEPSFEEDNGKYKISVPQNFSGHVFVPHTNGKTQDLIEYKNGRIHPEGCLLAPDRSKSMMHDALKNEVDAEIEKHKKSINLDKKQGQAR